MAFVDNKSNNQELYNSYMHQLDPDSSASLVHTIKSGVKPTYQSSIVIQKQVKKQQITWRKIIIGVVTMFIFYLIISSVSNFSSSTFISKYENFNNSNFTNKDQYEDPNGGSNDYDIHYLVEQMIYKEFSPSDKKKYLDLPKVVKEQYIQDYLIQKI